MIGKILNGKKPLISVIRTTTVREIVALLHQHRIGAVLVVEDEQIYGVVSERDICAGLHDHGSAILERPASAVMSAPVVTARPCDSVASAMAVMTDRRFRHLPVVEDGRIVGLVSIGDLVKQRIEAAEAEAAAMKDYIAS
ncbi:CBS domain-containing protein [Polymorphobacter sp.]|uniref:CBS domain-containing protein n=1 Tax=Polymorphobacter sp. TaxID=1909290 RepID=UPI003F72BDA3